MLNGAFSSVRASPAVCVWWGVGVVNNCSISSVALSSPSTVVVVGMLKLGKKATVSDTLVFPVDGM